MKVLILEDETSTALHLKKMAEELDPGIEVLGIIDSVESAVAWLRSHPEPDLMLVDIRLADGLSFDIFTETDPACPVIFTTAFDQYAIRAFKVNSIDYLLKPISREALNDALKKYRKLARAVPAPAIDYQKLAEMLAEGRPGLLTRLVIRYGETIRSVDIKDAAWFRTVEKNVFVVTTGNNTYPVDFSLDELESRLDSRRWFRINRQYLISFESIDRMTAYSKSRIHITLKPPCPEETITSTERSGDFKLWLAGK
jgi:DNA-binding LytR/AlgR family response regulator